jgi:hypothetical protein
VSVAAHLGKRSGFATVEAWIPDRSFLADEVGNNGCGKGCRKSAALMTAGSAIDTRNSPNPQTPMIGENREWHPSFPTS